MRLIRENEHDLNKRRPDNYINSPEMLKTKENILMRSTKKFLKLTRSKGKARFPSFIPILSSTLTKMKPVS